MPRAGVLDSGPNDDITDVGDVLVGHATLADGPVQTGVTVIVPGASPFTRKPLAACSVFNGFGKSAGLLQLAELGCLETPLALGNTFAVGTLGTALIREAMAGHPEIGRSWPTVNPLVLECNDGYLNDIRGLHVHEQQYVEARRAAGKGMAQGSVGAGRGMSTFGLKGGVGSASRLAVCPSGSWLVGALVLSNFGKPEQLRLAGQPVGALLKERLAAKQALTTSGDTTEKGSIIMVLATDAPVDTLQLGRLAKRAGNGLARTGSIFGHGSGDLAVAFSTAQHLPWPEPSTPLSLQRLPDTQMDSLFQAAADAVEQAIWKALFHAETVHGRDGHVRWTLQDILPDWQTLVSR